MCHSDTDLPALGPGITTATGSSIRLTAADGAVSRAFLATPGKPSGAGIVIFPDNRGLHQFYEDLACSLATQGHVALAIDYFGRTAGVAPRDDTFSPSEHLASVTRETVELDLQAALHFIRTSTAPRVTSVFTIGFCFGGRHSFLSSEARFGLAGVIGFYGRPGPSQTGAPGPTQLARELRSPILGFFGGADPSITGGDVKAFEDALAVAGVAHDLVTYPGAPHSFFDRHLEEFAPAAQDAWGRALEFIGANAA